MPVFQKEISPHQKLCGRILILAALVWLGAFADNLAACWKLPFLLSHQPANINFLLFLFLYTVISIPAGFIILLAAGAGLLKQKQWAQDLAGLIPFLGLPHIAGSLWLFGRQYYGLPALIILPLIYAYLLFASRIQRYPRLNLKAGIACALITTAVHFLPVMNWVRHTVPGRTPQPQVREYRIADEKFIQRNCIYREIFNLRTGIPRSWEIGIVARESSGNGWSVSFLGVRDEGPDALLVIKNSAFGTALVPAIRTLGFRRLYDFEKKILRPAFSPLYRLLKTFTLPAHLETVDEAFTSSWKGFVKISRDDGKAVQTASLYSLRGRETAGITLVSGPKTLSPEQMQSILAATEFRSPGKPAAAFFEEGRAALAQADYHTAVLAFVNACALDGKNADYPYYLARTLEESPGSTGRKARLNSAQRFLEDALRLQPKHPQAEKLYRTVRARMTKSDLER